MVLASSGFAVNSELRAPLTSTASISFLHTTTDDELGFSEVESCFHLKGSDQNQIKKGSELATNAQL